MENQAKEEPGQKKQILRRIYLFSGIPEDDLEVLAQMAVSKPFARQSIIFWEGREAQGFYLLTSGYVKLVKSSPDGKEYVAPGFIDTDMTRALSDAQQQALLQTIPLGRLGHVDDIAAAVVFLASPGAGYVTGTTLHVNGGMYMG